MSFGATPILVNCLPSLEIHFLFASAICSHWIASTKNPTTMLVMFCTVKYCRCYMPPDVLVDHYAVKMDVLPCIWRRQPLTTNEFINAMTFWTMKTMRIECFSFNHSAWIRVSPIMISIIPMAAPQLPQGAFIFPILHVKPKVRIRAAIVSSISMPLLTRRGAFSMLFV